jgi:hypothetical protein
MTLFNARLAAFAGAALVVLSTFVSWYAYDIQALGADGGGGQFFSAGADLWRLYAPWGAALVVVAGVGALAMLVPGRLRRVAASVAITAGVAIGVYAIVRMFEVPALGTDSVVLNPNGSSMVAGTAVDGGAFLALVGGALLAIGGTLGLAAAPVMRRTSSRSMSPNPA